MENHLNEHGIAGDLVEAVEPLVGVSRYKGKRGVLESQEYDQRHVRQGHPREKVCENPADAGLGACGNIPAEPVGKVGHRIIQIREYDGQVDGDISRDNKGMAGGFEPWELANQRIPYKPETAVSLSAVLRQPRM